MPQMEKRLLFHGLVDIIFIIASVRPPDMNLFSRHGDVTTDSYRSADDGPSLSLSAVLPSISDGQSRKSFRPVYDPIMDEYDRIMQDVRSLTPVNYGDAFHDNGVITMVLGMPDSSGLVSHGGLRVLSNSPVDGAVGGLGQPFMTDENLDIFNNFLPGNMTEDDINDLISGETVPSLNQSFPEVNWQQFITDYDTFVGSGSGITKAIDCATANLGTSDLLSEAIQSSELFLPVPPASQNSSEFEAMTDITESTIDPLTAARLEMIEFSEWATQDHQEDILFPSLPPPSYEEVMSTEQQQVNITSPEVPQQTNNNGHLHDHNYYNATQRPPRIEQSARALSASYAIRSRHEVGTRVISVPPRPRHISSSTDSSVSSSLDESTETNNDSEQSERIIPIDLQQSGTFDSFVIKPLNLTYFDNISKTVGAQREVILCN